MIWDGKLHSGIDVGRVTSTHSMGLFASTYYLPENSSGCYIGIRLNVWKVLPRFLWNHGMMVVIYLYKKNATGFGCTLNFSFLSLLFRVLHVPSCAYFEWSHAMLRLSLWSYACSPTLFILGVRLWRTQWWWLSLKCDDIITSSSAQSGPIYYRVGDNVYCCALANATLLDKWWAEIRNRIPAMSIPNFSRKTNKSPIPSK